MNCKIYLGILLLVGTAFANPPPFMPHAELLTRLTQAQRQWKSWNLAGTKTTLDRLSVDLKHDLLPYNQAARHRAESVVAAIKKSELKDADLRLDKLVRQVHDGVQPD
jgi:hypothetical protein